jgi:hypothetical protein
VLALLLALVRLLVSEERHVWEVPHAWEAETAWQKEWPELVVLVALMG